MSSAKNSTGSGEIIEALRRAVRPIAASGTDGDIGEFAAFSELLDQARVIGIGPATYGSGEFIQFTHRLMRFLVEKLGFRALVLEASMPDCLAVDRYLRTGEGDPEELLHELRFWVWDMAEMLELIRWMREYNHRHGPVLRFYGADSQLPRTGLETVLQFLEQVAPKHGETFAGRLTPFLGQPNWPETHALIWRRMGPADLLKLGQASKDLVDFLERSAADLIAKANAEQWNVAHRCAVNIMHYVGYFGFVEQPDQPPRMSISIEARARSIVENLLWALRQQKPGAGVIFLSHVAHVARVPIVPELPTPGALISDTLGPSAYLAIGCEFSEGGFWARPSGEPDNPDTILFRPEPMRYEPGQAGSLSDTLRQVGAPAFLFETRADDHSVAAAEWLSEEHDYRYSGGGFDAATGQHAYTKIVPASHFDLIAYFEKIDAARFNPRTRKRFETEAATD